MDVITNLGYICYIIRKLDVNIFYQKMIIEVFNVLLLQQLITVIKRKSDSPHCWSVNMKQEEIWGVTWTHFLSLSPSELRLCSAYHRPGYWSNLPGGWPSTVCAYSEQETENGPDVYQSSWKAYDEKSNKGVENGTIISYESRTHNDQRNVGRLTTHVAVQYQFEWGYGLSILTYSLISEKGWDGMLFCLLPLHRSPLRFRVNEPSVWYSLRLSRSDARFMSICMTSLNEYD